MIRLSTGIENQKIEREILNAAYHSEKKLNRFTLGTTGCAEYGLDMYPFQDIVIDGIMLVRIYNPTLDYPFIFGDRKPLDTDRLLSGIREVDTEDLFPGYTQILPTCKKVTWFNDLGTNQKEKAVNPDYLKYINLERVHAYGRGRRKAIFFTADDTYETPIAWLMPINLEEEYYTK